MAEIKIDKLTILEVGDDEFHLRMEEEKRDCLTCIYLRIVAQDGTQYPAIVLRDRIENKEAYMDTMAYSSWFLMQTRSKTVKLLFMNLDFQGAGKMKFCLDFSPGSLNKDNREELAIWIQDLLLSDGKVAIVDDGPAIIATGITLEVPRLILAGGL